MMELDGTRQRGRPLKNWWDCVKKDIKSLGLFREDAHCRNKRRRKLKLVTGYDVLRACTSVRFNEMADKI